MSQLRVDVVTDEEGTGAPSFPNGIAGVATIDTVQTLTNKTIAFADNTLTDVASINTVQTLTNKTLGDVKENITIDTSTSGTLTFNTNDQGIVYLTANQTADRTLNIVGDDTTTLDAYLPVGQSVTFAVLATQGATAYYFNDIQIDGGTVTPNWQGGTAPTEGNANSVDAYSFTVIKTAASTFTVLASQTQFA